MAQREREDEREEYSKGGDLVLAQGEMALVKDGSDGNVVVVVGPFLHSLTKTDESVRFDAGTNRFVRCSLSEAVQPWPLAKEGQYIVLENPVQEDGKQHPEKGKIRARDLDTGKKINIPGPTSFALFPGQSTEVIDGHILRTNQYLIARVINGEAAMENWEKAILKPQIPTVEAEVSSKAKLEKKEPSPLAPPHLVTGQLLVIKGTEISFYIPPTGVEVIVDESGKYVRDAVTLEQLEYCILLDEEGTKEFVYGPKVVFPKPTQSFYTGSEGRKFRAVELNDLMGLYIKVIRSYDDFQEGDELFITGKEQRIYWPRVEHSIIRYGDRDMHYAVAIPKGEARYVLDRNTGEVKLVEGPKMFLPDPRKEVIVRRVLPLNLVKLLYPGNAEAVKYNQSFMVSEEKDEGVFRGVTTAMYAATMASQVSGGEKFERKETFTPPRTIQLDTKYDSAVRVMIWTGYAMKVVSMTGKQRVVVGPATTFLEYDEVPELFELSTGTPKSDDDSIKDVYLRVKANKVSDMIQAETLDYVQVQIPISYRVSFEGVQEKWFDVENYVKFLTDHLRSLVANVVKQHGIEKFNGSYINILRDAILGVSTIGSKEKQSERPGRAFEENGMRIYDVELGQLTVGDEEIEDILLKSQHESVQQALSLTMDRKELEVNEQKQEILQRTNAIEAATTYEKIAIDLEKAEKNAELSEFRLSASLKEEEANTQIHGQELERQGAKNLQDREHIKEMMAMSITEVVDKAKAITPAMIEAVQIFADKDLAGKLAEAMSPLAILGGTSIADVFSKLIKGTSLEALKLRGDTRRARTKE